MLSYFFTNPIILGIVQALITTSLALVTVFVASKRGLNIKKEVVIALARGIIQITAIGSVLLLFLKSPTWTSFIVLFVMFVVAGFTSAQRAKKIKGAFKASFYGISLASILVIGLMTALGVIKFSVISLVPVGSMIIAAAMNSNALALNRLRSEVIAHTGLMTGMVLSGSDPIYAAIYQFVVMGMIFATSGLSAMITVFFIQKQIFSKAEQLLIYE